ncbi:MAG: 3-oxoacyl-[acyl-carrier-protein] reductase [Lentisphaeria bacterium]|nr:3-oxoacyl-[acyl-carrier-protein] reductase [Lentisphaeria bacterium]
MGILSGQTAIVTGGTRGIGRAIVKAFLQEGAKVAFFGTNLEAAQAVAKELSAECGIDESMVAGYACDIKDTGAVQTAFDTVLAALGGSVDILVNNAGITKDNLVMRLPEADWDAVIDTDLKGVYNCIHAAVRSMLKARKGRIINISSIVGIMGNAGQANYAAAKAGVIGLTKAVARELASRSITVNAVAPGFVQTAMTDVLSEALKEKLKTQIPLGRIAQPEEIAAAVLFFASPAAAYVTGQVLAVDGGMAM